MAHAVETKSDPSALHRGASAWGRTLFSRLQGFLWHLDSIPTAKITELKCESFPPASLAERLAQRCRDGVCCAFDGVCCKVSIARGCLHLCVAQQLADHR